jgi:predicted DNA-binding transcriptional regulator YafY
MADTRLQRTLQILWKLSRERNVTVNDLYEYMERRVSKRSIQRALRDLSSSDIPIVSTSGPHNEHHYSLERPFDYLPEVLTADEVLAAVLLSQFSSMFNGTRIGDDIGAVLKKLRNMLPANSLLNSSTFESGDYAFYHQPGKTALTRYADSLKLMFQAILSSTVCNVHYGEKHYHFHPYALLLHNGAVYVLGTQPKYGNMIYLAVNRLRKVEHLRQSFKRDESFNLREFIGNSFGIWYEQPVNVRMLFSPAVRHSIEHRQWHSSQRVHVLPDNSLLLSMHVGPSLELMAWILRWGEHVEVLEPASLREMIRNTATAMAEKHSQAR